MRCTASNLIVNRGHWGSRDIERRKGSSPLSVEQLAAIAVDGDVDEDDDINEQCVQSTVKVDI